MGRMSRAQFSTSDHQCLRHSSSCSPMHAQTQASHGLGRLNGTQVQFLTAKLHFWAERYNSVGGLSKRDSHHRVIKQVIPVCLRPCHDRRMGTPNMPVRLETHGGVLETHGVCFDAFRFNPYATSSRNCTWAAPETCRPAQKHEPPSLGAMVTYACAFSSASFAELMSVPLWVSPQMAARRPCSSAPKPGVAPG